MDTRSLSRLLIGLGIAAIIVGVLVRFGVLGWFGNLPGDIRIDTGRTRVFVPLMSMLLVSVVLSVVLSLFRR